MSYYGQTVLNLNPIKDDNEFLGYLENCLSIRIEGEYYAIEYNPQELYCHSKTSRVSPQEFFERLDRLLARNLVSFFACIHLFNKLCALRKKNAHLPAVQANVDRLLQALLASQVVQRASHVDFVDGLGAGVYKEFIDFVKEVLLSEAVSRDEDDSASLLQQYLSRFIPLLDQDTKLRLSVLSGDYSGIQLLHQNKGYRTLIHLLFDLKYHERARQFILEAILTEDPLGVMSTAGFVSVVSKKTFLDLLLCNPDCAKDSPLRSKWLYWIMQNAWLNTENAIWLFRWVVSTDNGFSIANQINLNFWAQYLENADLENEDYIHSVQEVFQRVPNLTRSLFFPIKASTTKIQTLLTVSERYPGLDMQEPIRYLFAQYPNCPEVLPLIMEYFLHKRQHPKASILLTLEEEEQFIRDNLFRLMKTCCWSKDNRDFNNLLIEELKIKLIDKNLSDYLIGFIFEFVKQHGIVDTHIISALAERAMETDSLPEQDILELAELSVLSGDLVLMRKILNHYHKNPRDETVQGQKWQDFIKAILKEGHYKSKPVAEPMIGLLYGHQQGFLSDTLEFDFLLSPCCHNYHRIWFVANRQEMTADSDLRVHESSMMDQYQAAPVYEAAKSAFPSLNVKASYDKLIQYIEENLRSLEEDEGRAGNKQFIPEYRYKKEGTVSGKIEETTGEECLEEMTERQMAIARYYTALRLLKRAKLAANSFNPYFNDSGMDFNSMVAYCYEIAKKSGCLGLLVAQLADIRRIHSMDTKAGALSAEDQASCSSGSRGRLCRTYVVSHNRQLELAREKLGLEIKKFNSDSINAVIERFVQNTLIAFKIDILKNVQISAIPEEYRHLAAIFSCYQKMIAGESLSNEEKHQAEQAIASIVDKKIDYLALYQNLAKLHTNDKISVCPEEVQSALRSYIACQLKALFLLDEESQDKLGAAALAIAGSLEERDLRWKDFPETIVANTYPEILIHFLLADTSNFSLLAEHAAYLATPKFRDNMQGILYQLAERLSDQRALPAEDEKSAKDAYALFFEQMHTLAASGIIPKEDLSAIFIRILLVALHNRAFFLEIISFIKGDANLSETDLRDIFAQVIISALQYKVPNEKIIHFMEEVNREFNIDVKVQCADLLDKVPYVHYAQLNKLLKCLAGTIPVTGDTSIVLIELSDLREIIANRAKKLIQNHDYTAYLRLIRLPSSAFNIKIDLYDRAENKEFVKNKREAVASILGSFSSINPERIKHFKNLKAASVKGDAYASFALMELYSKGHAIAEDGKSRIEDGSLAIVYAAIAIEQAKALGNQDLIREVQSFFGRNTRIFCLEELYYSYLHKLLMVSVESPFYNSALQVFLLIISSIDLGMVLDDGYESKNKSAVQKLIAQCCSHNDLVKAENLLRVCEMMQERNAYIQSAGGNVRAADPRNLSTAIRYNLHYQWLLAELKKIALLKPPSITAQDIYLRLRQVAGSKGSEVADNLKHVYKHLCKDFLYDKSIDNDDETLTQLFKQICEKEQISLNIKAPNSPFIAGSDKSAAKGKDREKSKEKEAVNSVFARLQHHHTELSAQLKAYPNTRSALSEMDDILTQMIESDGCTELQIGTLRSLLEIIKLAVADDQEVADEIKVAVNDLILQMLNLFDDRLAMVEDDESSSTPSWIEAAVDPSGSSLSSSDASAGFFVQRNLKGQPYTRSMSSSRLSEASDSSANPLSTLSSSIRSSRRSEASDSSANPFSTFFSSHPGSSSSSRSSRCSEASDSRSNFVHSASSSSGSSLNLSSDSAGTTMGSRFLHTISLIGSWASANQGGGCVEVEAPTTVPTNIDAVLSDLVDPHRDYGAAIARPLTGIVPVGGRKKIALIGDSAVGKSCLLLRLVDDIYVETYISTIGVDFKAHTAMVGGQTFRSNIWDLCGQDRFRTTANANANSYHQAGSIAVCFDVSDHSSFVNIKAWCRAIERSASSNAKVILIGTKCDLEAERQVPYDTARNFADTLGIYYLETSARDSIHIDRLGAFIALAPYSRREQHLELARDYDMGVPRQNRFGL